LSLPLQADPHPADVATAWFANLLPEGAIREHVASALGISARNEFAMLEGIGGDCAGALRIVPEQRDDLMAGGLVPLPWDKLERILAVAPRPSLLAVLLQGGEVRLSLAGAQDKIPVHVADGTLSLPRGRLASTHLLKIPAGELPDLPQNELLCLSLARAVGLPAPAATMAPSSTPMLLVARYDRLVHDGGRVQRLHQEDLCQALGLPPESKYEFEGGPSLAAMFDVVQRGSVAPLPDKRDLLRWVVFNVLIGNADAHAKNVSLLHGPQDGPRLAPFYDLVCTEAYPLLSSRLAQKIGGEYRPAYVRTRHWERLAATVGVNPRYLRRLASELCDLVEVEASALADDIAHQWGGEETLARIVGVVGKRVAWVRREVESTGS
jgi:serine/threonine-protein kinase HipA